MTESDDLPDYTNETHVTVEVEDNGGYVQVTNDVEVIAHPTGKLTEEGAGILTNTSTYTSIVSKTVTDGKKYQLGKIEVPMVNAHWIQIEVDSSVVKTYYAGKADTFVMFYLYNEVSLTGDGSKKVDVKAMAVSTGETIYGYMSGEEE